MTKLSAVKEAVQDVTFPEILIMVVIVGILVAVAWPGPEQTSTRCLEKGYIHQPGTKFCTKVQNGNTIVIHADSLR